MVWIINASSITNLFGMFLESTVIFNGHAHNLPIIFIKNKDKIALSIQMSCPVYLGLNECSWEVVGGEK